MDALDPGNLKALTDLAAAQLDKNRIEQSKLNLERRREQISLELIETGQRQAQETILLRQRVEQFLAYQQQHALQDDALQDFFSNLSERIETIERGLMLVLMERLDSPQVQAEGQRIIGDLGHNLTVASKQRQLASYHKSVNALEEQRAEGDDDIKLINKIARIKEEIERLEKELH